MPALPSSRNRACLEKLSIGGPRRELRKRKGQGPLELHIGAVCPGRRMPWPAQELVHSCSRSGIGFLTSLSSAVPSPSPGTGTVLNVGLLEAVLQGCFGNPGRPVRRVQSRNDPPQDQPRPGEYRQQRPAHPSSPACLLTLANTSRHCSSPKMRCGACGWRG